MREKMEISVSQTADIVNRIVILSYFYFIKNPLYLYNSEN
jgi:hypothetical protein